ncbi:B3 domain-containing protein At5g42700-like [Euphorbia lathyris]|uniref:B3 domain-containing protein At5g42700-like n=1 Tax=Euphorbia lathyris TaxID=212925 RepID=UPI0033136C75
MVVRKSNYENIREKRLEENKKRMEELNLKSLSLDLQSASPKKSPMKQAKPRIHRVKELVPVRRSSRFADKPTVTYKEMVIEYIDRPRRGYNSYNRHRDLLNRIYASDEVRTLAIDKAEELQSGLGSKFPSFVKPMLQSHVTGGFWLGLPVQFCKDHLPSRDEFITLEDENGDETESKYLAAKTGLSAGWRGFAIAHELVDGDALVFQLVSRTKFKVYIIRAYEENPYGKEENENNGSDNENNQMEEVEEKNLDTTSQKKEEVEEKKLDTTSQKMDVEDKNMDSIGKRTRGRKRRSN